MWRCFCRWDCFGDWNDKNHKKPFWGSQPPGREQLLLILKKLVEPHFIHQTTWLLHTHRKETDSVFFVMWCQLPFKVCPLKTIYIKWSKFLSFVSQKSKLNSQAQQTEKTSKYSQILCFYFKKLHKWLSYYYLTVCKSTVESCGAAQWRRSSLSVNLE